MENSTDAFSAAAADVLKNPAPAGAAPPGKRKRGRPPKDRSAQPSAAPQPAAAPAEPAPEVQTVVDPAQFGAAVMGLLQRLSEGTRTTPPSPEEAESIGGGLAYGLSRTKLISENPGPWTPLALAGGLYALPRALEMLFRWMDERAARARAAEEIPDGRRFQIVESGTAADADAPAPAGAPAPISTGVPARGAKVR